VKANLIRQRLITYSKQLKIPLYTFTEDTALSGAYLILSAGDKSFGLTSSMVGGIGSAYYGLNFKGLADTYGIQRRSIDAGAQTMSQKIDPISEMTADTKQWLQSLLKDSH
jgi:protease-4